MVGAGLESRKSLRYQKTLPVVVKGKDDNDESWEEVAEIRSFSRTGAGFHLERECKVGQLLSLMIPLPSNLRCYDEDKELYKVWGLIQHCSKLPDETGVGFHIGVAFIGKNAPESYHLDSQQSYKICGMDEDGLWKISEAQRPFVHRKHPRYWASVEVSLSVHRAELPEEFEIIPETTVTENISLSGALVFSNFNVNIGDCIDFRCEKYDFSTLAIVRNRTRVGVTMPKLHLEFINGRFPIQKINTNIEEGEKN